MKDWTGNKWSAHSQLGSRTLATHDRKEHDYYATSPVATQALVDNYLDTHYTRAWKIWEPACGEGHMSEVLLNNGFQVVSSDLIDRGYGEGGVDFLQTTQLPDYCKAIVTNPPYRYATEFIEHSLELLTSAGDTLCVLLNLNYLTGKRRYEEIFKLNPPERVLVFSRRIECAPNGKFTGTRSAINYAWFIWKNLGGSTHIPFGETRIEWI